MPNGLDVAGRLDYLFAAEAAMVEYSVIVPAHDEAECLPGLLREIAEVMATVEGEYEAIVVDDGSSDASVSVLSELQSRDPALRVLCMDGNHGQSSALEAGLRAARGAVLITLDADGQNPPAEIAPLLAALPGWDAVCGWRKDRNDSRWKRFSSRVANGVRRAVLNDTIRDVGCSLRVFRRECLERMQLRMFRGLHRFFPVLLQLAGCRVHQLPVAHRPRRHGRSHYATWNRLIGPLADLWAVRWMKRRWPHYEWTELPRAAGDARCGDARRRPE